MMNKSKIDWTDFTWNPVTGCNRGCTYCYARKQAARFCGDIRLNKASPQLTDAGNNTYILEQPFKNSRGSVIPFPAGFAPTLHTYRLGLPAKKKKPAVIFVCSMADLFAPHIPTSWIINVFDACLAAPWHKYIFLTKHPERYNILDRLALLPREENFWYGMTATTTDDLEAWNDMPITHWTDYPDGTRLETCENSFLNIEPILGPVDIQKWNIDPKWIILGAETGNRTGKVKPKIRWIEEIQEAAQRWDIPLFIKDSDEIRAVIGQKLPQAYPPGLRFSEPTIPHCKECEHCTKEPQGKRGEACFCTIGNGAESQDNQSEARHIPGRFTRTSPPWCPLREPSEKET